MTELRDKDYLVLQKITSATTLENHHVTYAFQKLEDLDLINVSRPDTMVKRVLNGQKRVFQHPKQAEITEKGEKYLERADKQTLDEYENLSHRELVEKTHGLENRLKELEGKFETFREQVQRNF